MWFVDLRPRDDRYCCISKYVLTYIILGVVAVVVVVVVIVVAVVVVVFA